jgi:peptide chain release factor subunit 1
VAVANDADTQLLARVIDEHPRMAVVMLDGGDARIYLAQQGAAVTASESSVELPNRHDQGGWSQARFQRHIQFHHEQRLQEVAERLKDLFYERPFGRLVLVGVDSATNDFAGHLSDPLRRRLIGALHADFKQETDEAILDRARGLARQQERSAEVARVQEIVNFTDEGGRGALGLADTIRCLIEGRADTIAVVDGLTARGSRCLNCDYFAPETFQTCPVCASEDVDELADAVEHTIEYALINGSRVNVVFDEAAEMLQARGGIGALLRYAG